MNIRKIITLLATIAALAGTSAQAINCWDKYYCESAFNTSWEARKNHGLGDRASAALSIVGEAITFYLARGTTGDRKFEKCIRDSNKHEPKCYAYAGDMIKAAVIAGGTTINDSPARDAYFKALTEHADKILAGRK